MHTRIYITHPCHGRRRLLFAQHPGINFAPVSIIECHLYSPTGLVSSRFFGSHFASFQKPLAAASMARTRKSNERQNKLVPALFAFPFPVAIHLHDMSVVIFVSF